MSLAARFALAPLAAVAALALGGCDYLRPFEQLCERKLAPAEITVEAVPVSYRTDFSLSSRQLTAMGAASAGRLTLGLTQTNLKSSVSLGGKGITHRFTGRHCMRASVHVRLAFEPMTVYVSRDHPPGSCAHEITMGHELKHVRVYENFLAEVSEKIERELRANFGEGTRYFSSQAEAEKQVQTQTHRYLAPFVQESMKGVTARQAKIDSEEEYFRLDRFQASCRDGSV
ncbi:MAG: hypothetical protein HY661_21270 [Betaproteobacteria bacterium]|nr:hypothetical protein [Betaproteobacteria bacterium]